MKITKISEYRYTIDYLGDDEVNYEITIEQLHTSKPWNGELNMYTDTWHNLASNFKIKTKEAAFEWALDKLQSLAIEIAFRQTRADFKRELKRIEAE